jgi:ribosomal protein L11 methyltransferase
MKRWLVIFLIVPKGFGEAISNFLIEEGATGVEEVEEDLRWEKFKVYFPPTGKGKKVLRSLSRYLKSLEKIVPEMSRVQIETTSIAEQDWGENWKRFFKPVQATSTFVVKPPWSKIRLKENQIPIDIYPAMAFGTGTHATTRLCLRALERRPGKKGFSVLDVGTGSGILSIAAARLGAHEVLGLDIDGAAVKNARENVERNRVSDIVKIRKGRIGDIQKRFDRVVANIDFKNLKRMRRPLIHHLKGQGFLILSGILMEEEERIRRHYLEVGLLRWVETDREGEWACLVFKKRNSKQYS